MLWVALINQKAPFWKIAPRLILKLKAMYCSYQVTILIGGYQYLSTNYVFLLHSQMQTWKVFLAKWIQLK